MARTKVFVSYSRDDRDWLKRFSIHLAVLQRRGLVEPWSDERISVGADWEKEIEFALIEAKVAVLMISPSFLASGCVWEKEMPRIVAHSEQGMEALPLILRPCAWRLEEDLARLQARPADGKALSLGSESEINSKLSDFVYELAERIGKSPAAMAPLDAQSESVPVRTATNNIMSSIRGVWVGHYKGTRPVRLVVREADGDSFAGQMEYPAEGTITKIQGTVHPRWSRDDPLWAHVGGRSLDDSYFVARFQETGYRVKGQQGYQL